MRSTRRTSGASHFSPEIDNVKFWSISEGTCPFFGHGVPRTKSNMQKSVTMINRRSFTFSFSLSALFLCPGHLYCPRSCLMQEFYGVEGGLPWLALHLQEYQTFLFFFETSGSTCTLNNKPSKHIWLLGLMYKIKDLTRDQFSNQA